MLWLCGWTPSIVEAFSIHDEFDASKSRTKRREEEMAGIVERMGPNEGDVGR